MVGREAEALAGRSHYGSTSYMIGTSYRTRGAVFAFLFGPPRVITRQEGVAVYEAVCNALGVDDLTYQYAASQEPDSSGLTAAAPSSGFSVQMQRRIGRGALGIRIDSQGHTQPLRLVVEYTWPPSLEHVYEEFDMAANAAFGALSGTWQKVLAETRIRGQVEAVGASALNFLLDRALRLESERVEALEAKPSFVSLTLETPAGDPSADNPLRQPKREFKIELLREDARSIYVELMSQWPQLAPTSDGTLELDTRRIRSFDHAPSEYLRNSVDFLNERAFPLFAQPAG